MKRFTVISVITLLFLIAAYISIPFNVKILYYQTSPMRLAKADAELGDLNPRNCTVKGMKRYIEFVKKTYSSTAYRLENIEKWDDEDVVKANREIAVKNQNIRYKYVLMDQDEDSARVKLYIETNNDAANKAHNTKGQYYSYSGPIYKMVKEKGKWIINEKYENMSAGKPVIYLYPTSEQEISVKLNFQGELTCTYPDYQGQWRVKAQPDGKLTNITDGREYSYLYWEGTYNNKWDMTKGFVVKGTDTAKFLQEKLQYLGLTPKEYNEFIVYWLPILQSNVYNLIYFAGEDYENIAQLSITPHPDSILRVMMVYKPLVHPVIIEEQDLKPFERKGFAVVEWGGTEAR